MKKNLLPLLLVAGVAAYFYMRSRSKGRVTVTADSPEKQTESEFLADQQLSVPEGPRSVIDAASGLITKLFPKKTAEQKAAKKTARLQKRTARKTKKSASVGFSDDSVLV